jgi:hypothetical protein
MLETDKLQSCLPTIRGHDLNVYQTQGFHAVILDLSNSCRISGSVNLHSAEEIPIIVSIVLNFIYQLIKGNFVCRF